MERLLPLGQWAYDKSRDSCDYFPLVSGFTTNLAIRAIRAIRVQRKIHPLSIRVLSGIRLNSADE